MSSVLVMSDFFPHPKINMENVSVVLMPNIQIIPHTFDGQKWGNINHKTHGVNA